MGVRSVILTAAILSFFTPPTAVAEQVPSTLSHQPVEYELHWKNDSNRQVIMGAMKKAEPSEECRLDLSRVPPTPPGGVAKLPVICEFRTFGSVGAHPRAKRFGIQIIDPKINTNKLEFVSLETNVYPKSEFTDEIDTCEGRLARCKNEPFRERVKLCFIDKQDDDNSIQNVYSTECRGMRKLKVTDSKQMGLEIAKVRNHECGIVEEVRVFGHANEYGIQVGSFMRGPSDIDRSFNKGVDRCVMSKDLKIVYKGCNSGHGCLGQINMFAMANILNKVKATVLSPTSYAINSRFTLFKSGSINFKERKLTTVREAGARASAMSERWDMVGKLSAGSATLAEQCRDLCSEIEAHFFELRRYWRSRPSCEQDIAANQIHKMEMLKTEIGGCTNWKTTSTPALVDSISRSPSANKSNFMDRLHGIYRVLGHAAHLVDDGTDEAKNQAKYACELNPAVAGDTEKKGLPEIESTNPNPIRTPPSSSSLTEPAP